MLRKIVAAQPVRSFNLTPPFCSRIDPTPMCSSQPPAASASLPSKESLPSTASLPSQRRVENVIVVASPKAGTGAGREQIPILCQKLSDAGVCVTQTSSIDHMKRCLSDGPSPQSNPLGSIVVAAGGDGTLSLVADNIDPDVPLIPMPFGTENLLARFFGYRPTAECIFETIYRGNSYRMDAGRGNGKLFLVMASCGFDAEVVRSVHLKRQGHINRFSYARPILRALWRYRFPGIKVTKPKDDATGQNLRSTRHSAVTGPFNPDSNGHGWTMVFNLPRYGGGLTIEPDAVGTDGKLDLIAFHKRSIVSGLRYFLGILVGGHTKFPDVSRHRIETIQLQSDGRVPYQLDGDYAGRLPLQIETLPRRVHLLLPSLEKKNDGRSRLP